MTLFDLNAPGARKRAMRSLMLGDHGFLRVWFANRHQITPKMARSNQPSPKRIAEEAARGVKTILNVRGDSPEGFYALEREACEEHGIALVDFRFRSRDVPSPEDVLAWKALLSEIEYPALIHCKSGADRAGIAAALYMILHEGVSVEEGMGQLDKKYLHAKAGKTGVLDFYFEEYLKSREASGVGFEDWVRAGYDPKEIRAKFKDTPVGNFFVDKVLRRE